MRVLKEFPTLMAHNEKNQQRSTQHALAYEFDEKPIENANQSIVMVPSKQLLKSSKMQLFDF